MCVCVQVLVCKYVQERPRLTQRQAKPSASGCRDLTSLRFVFRSIVADCGWSVPIQVLLRAVLIQCNNCYIVLIQCYIVIVELLTLNQSSFDCFQWKIKYQRRFRSFDFFFPSFLNFVLRYPFWTVGCACVLNIVNGVLYFSVSPLSRRRACSRGLPTASLLLASLLAPLFQLSRVFLWNEKKDSTKGKLSKVRLLRTTDTWRSSGSETSHWWDEIRASHLTVSEGGGSLILISQKINLNTALISDPNSIYIFVCIIVVAKCTYVCVTIHVSPGWGDLKCYAHACVCVCVFPPYSRR